MNTVHSSSRLISTFTIYVLFKQFSSAKIFLKRSTRVVFSDYATTRRQRKKKEEKKKREKSVPLSSFRIVTFINRKIFQQLYLRIKGFFHDHQLSFNTVDESYMPNTVERRHFASTRSLQAQHTDTSTFVSSTETTVELLVRTVRNECHLVPFFREKKIHKRHTTGSK
jgi:hypothetical protein